MKKLLALLLLAGGCSAPETSTLVPVLAPAQSAVAAYMKKTLDDPASYQPVRWGKVTPFLKQEQIQGQALALIELGRQQGDSTLDLIRGEASAQSIAQSEALGKRLFAHADTVAREADRLFKTHDSTSLGASLSHSFRAKNKMGAVVLDSARFVVMNDGTVTAMRLP